jgi:hexosaminidase
MVKKSVYFLFFFAFISCQQQVDYRKDIASFLIPKPIDINQQKGYFQIDKYTKIITTDSLIKEATYLQKLIDASSLFKIKIDTDYSENQDTPVIVLKTLPNKDSNPINEGYQIISHANKIELIGNSAVGLMRGIQTLRQLFVDDFYSGKKRRSWQLPLVLITDAPKFKHRGMLLDCSRHFFDVGVVKKYIDLLALYKMNVLHWHLTEDQGWRIAIDSFPKLTSVGAYRTEADGSIYGGFYTKNQIKEIVAYATERAITIIPEIEMPGHSQAALAAYPELSCTGNKIAVANNWGVFKDIYCAGNEQTFTFLETVLTEVMDLFPSEYIHIGGDEAPKTRWDACVKCQKRMSDEHLKNTQELQSYFIRRIEKFLNAHGRKLIGWDEILEGGLSPNATVQSWRGQNGGIEAANHNQFAIMSPTSHCYFDYGIASTDLQKVYKFDPIPENLPKDKQKFILGGECNLWSEYIPTEDNLDSKVFPRLLAMTEVLWSYPQNRNFDEFYNRIQNQYPFLDALHVNYGLEFIPVSLKSSVKNQQVFIKITGKTNQIKTKYRWNCSDCDSIFMDIPDSLILQQSAELELEAFKNDKKYGDNLKQTFYLHQAIGSKVTYQFPYSTYYQAAGDLALVDGLLGSTSYRDGNWQGFSGDDDLLIDLGDLKQISTIGAHFLHRQNSWIMAPKFIKIQTSVDGKTWVDWGTKLSKMNPKTEKDSIETLTITTKSLDVRFIKFLAKNVKALPTWHDAAGSEAWLFMDELIIN